jgi:hypothetical protein
MTEQDLFEQRLRGALRRHTANAPVVFNALDFAHAAATRAPRRRGLARVVAWRLAPTPMPAWVIVMTVLLLTALVAGLLVAGSRPQQELPLVVPPVGQVFTCPPGSTPDKPGPVDQARPTDPSPTMAFDRRANRLVAVAGTVAGPVETWAFDVCTNTWTRMYPDREPPPGGFGQLVYDVDSDLTIASDGTRMWAYDLEANTWTEKGPFAPFADPRFPSLRFYDPVSGHVVALGDDEDDDTLGLELWSYDVETDTWTPIPQSNRLAIGPHYEFFTYDASVDRLVAYANAWIPIGDPAGDGNWLFRAKTWLFDFRSGKWSGTGAVAPQFSAGLWGHGPGIAYDEAAERTVMLGQGHSAAYDLTADRWETLSVTPPEDQLGACGTSPECRQMPQMVYDPVNQRLVAFGGFLPTAAGEVWPDDLLAFDTRTREWTVLLEPRDRQPAPSSE